MAATLLNGIYAIFDYNRGNFMADRYQRQKMEYQVLHMRLTEAELWREDVRESLKLTPEKMKAYLTVLALELAAAGTALCKARVPAGTPAWLVQAHTLAIASAITYLVLGLWFGLHAFVSAQAYKVRILTQLVRLPVPTWQMLEAGRTYASDFEGQKGTQLLRVPFITGAQERAVASQPTQGIDQETGATAQVSDVAADPWGLERRGDDIQELALGVNTSEVDKQRHVWLLREASRFFQSYDAFCRLAINIGTSSLATFFSFHCLSYLQGEIRSPIAAWAGMIVFNIASIILIRSDFNVSMLHLTVSSVMLMLPPLLCAFVTMAADKNHGDPQTWEVLMPTALLIKGIDFLYLLWLFNVNDSATGTQLPFTFRDVLFVDPFGWAEHSGTRWQATAEAASRTQQRTAEEEPKTTLLASRFAWRSSKPLRPEDLLNRSGLRVRGGDAFHPMPASAQDAELPESQAFQSETFMERRASSIQTSKVHSAHLSDKPGAGPWRALRISTVLVAVMWISASAFALKAFLNGDDEVFILKPEQHSAVTIFSLLEQHKVERVRQLFGTKVDTHWHSALQRPEGLTCDEDGKVFVTSGRFVDGTLGVFGGSMLDSHAGAPQIVFDRARGCQGAAVTVEPIQDVAMLGCSDRGCTVAVLPQSGSSIHICSLWSVGGMTSQKLGQQWLEDRGGYASNEDSVRLGLLQPEEISSISFSTGAGDEQRLAVGTSTGRLVELRRSQDEDRTWFPIRLLRGRVDNINNFTASGTVALLQSRGVLAVLVRRTGTVNLLDLQDGGAKAGAWQLPQGKHRWASICAARDALYALEASDRPRLWKFRLPKEQKKSKAK